MRIALYHNLPSGGAKRVVYEATRRLATSHEVDVYTLSSADHDFADLRPHVGSHKIFDFRPFPLLSSPLGRLNQAIRLVDLLRLRSISRSIAQAIEQGDYDVVLVHPCQFEKSPSLLSHLQVLPSVYYCHEPLRFLYETMPGRPYDYHSTRQRLMNRVDPMPTWYCSVLKRTDLRNTRSANTVLANSKFTCDAIGHIYGVDALVSYPGVDTQCFRPLPVDKDSMLLSVGSLTPLKGFDFLIQAVAGIPCNQRPSLIIASNFQSPPERDYLKQLATELNVDLKLLANIRDKHLVRLYNQARVVVYAPIREPFGLVPLEAMACDTPVVGVREGGVPESIVHQHTGLLVERDPAQFAAAIQHLLSNPSLASEYGRNGREHVLRNWTWDESVATLEHHLATCAGL